MKKDNYNVAVSGTVNLVWNGDAKVTRYTLDRYDGNSQLRQFVNLTGQAFVDDTVSQGQTYRYQLYGFNQDAMSLSSNEVAITVQPAPPPTPTPGDNLIRQGGFEAPNLPGSSYRYTNLVGSEWTFDNGSGIARDGSDFNNASAPEGVQVAFVQGTGSIKQTVTFSAGTYALRFQAAARGGLTDDYSIKIDGTTIDTLIQSNNPYSGYQQVTSQAFSVAAGAHEIQFIGINSGGGDRTVFLDDVQTVTATPKPAAPTNLVATAGDSVINLSWDAVNGATSYKIKWSNTNGGTYTTLAAAPPTNAFTHTGLTNGTTYYYRVYAVGAAGNSADSEQAQATPVAQLSTPAAPTGFTATAVNTQIKLAWNAVNGATSYKVFRSTTSGSYNYAAPLATTTATSYDDSSVVNGTTYFYVVRAVNTAGESPNSAEGSATVTVEPFTILNVSDGDVLSGMISVEVQVNSPQIATLSLVLLIDGKQIVYFIPASNDDNGSSNIWTALVRTSMFSNTSSVALEVNDGLGYSQVRTVGIQNDISNLTFGTLFDVDPTATDVPHVSRVTATVTNGSGWTATIENDSQQVVRTFSGSGPTLDFSWDGRSNTGVQQPNGNYLVSIKKSAPANLHSNPSGKIARQFPAPKRNNCGGNYLSNKTDECGIQLVQLSGETPVEFAVNMHSIIDTMILLDETSVDGNSKGKTPVLAARLMMNYSKYIRTQISTRALQFDSPANPIIIPSSLTPLNGFKDSVHARIKNNLSGKPLKLFYADSHGQDGHLGIPGTHAFHAGGVYYFPKNPGASWPSNLPLVVISDLTYKWNYGELGDDNNSPTDPPKLVWIHACESAGSPGTTPEGSPTNSSVFSSFPIEPGDITTWAECFGIDPARGYEGAFVGISGYGKSITDNPDQSWTKMRYNFWYFLFTEGENVRTALIKSVYSSSSSNTSVNYIAQRYRTAISLLRHSHYQLLITVCISWTFSRIKNAYSC